MQQRLCRTPILGVADLKRRLITPWSDLWQHVIDKAINQWHEWLSACVKTDRRLTLQTFALIL